jgi:hypothetical protein
MSEWMEAVLMLVIMLAMGWVGIGITDVLSDEVSDE